MDYACGYLVPQKSPTAEECDRIRTNLACVQDPCCRPCPPFEEHKMPAAGIPTGSGETVAETLNWKKPICVNPCDSVPRECVAIASCPPPPPKLVIGPCPPHALRQTSRPVENARLPLKIVDPCNTKCPYLATACPSQRPQQYSMPTKREDALLGYVGGPQTMASVAPFSAQRMERIPAPISQKLTIAVSERTEVPKEQKNNPRLLTTAIDPCNTKCPYLAAACPSQRQFSEPTPLKLTPREAEQKYDCDSKTSRRCENDCPECPIEIHNRTIYPKCEAMLPGYGGHVPGITTCKFGKTFGRETREALQKVYSTPQLKTYPKKC